MSNLITKSISIDEEEDKRDLPSYMTSYQIFVRNITISQILPSHQETTNPYVTIRLKGGQKYSMTNSQTNTLNAQYDDILHLDGQSVGSDVLMLLVFNQNGEQNPDKDECLGIQKLVISSLELGLVKEYDLKLYKTIDGTTKRDYNSRIGSAGVLHIELHVAKLGTMQFQPKLWPPRIFYTLWLHVDKCKNVPVQKGAQVNPFIITKISPCLNQQKQTTPVCFNSSNPVWNILQCFHIDSFEKQTVDVSLMNYEKGSQHKKISSLKIPIHLARTDGKPFLSQMLFQLKGHMTKGCVFIFKMQLLEPGNIPFDGMVSMKHQKLKLNIKLHDLINLPASDPLKPVYCVVSCGKIYKKTKEIQNTNPAEINQEIIIHDITQSQLVLVNVIIDNQVYGQVPIHLNNYLLKTQTEAEYYSLFNKASAAVKFDLLLSSEEPEFEDKEETSDKIDEGVEIKVPENINNYVNSYDKTTSANSSPSSSATSSPTKAPEAEGSERIKALLQQAKAGEMSKAVESTAKNGSFEASNNTQEKSQKSNRIQQLANSVFSTKTETSTTTVSQTQTQTHSSSSNKANLAQKFLNSINSQKGDNSSQENVKSSSTSNQSQKDSNKIDKIKQTFDQINKSSTETEQEEKVQITQMKQMFKEIRDNQSDVTQKDPNKIEHIKQVFDQINESNSSPGESAPQVKQISIQLQEAPEQPKERDVKEQPKERDVKELSPSEDEQEAQRIGLAETTPKTEPPRKHLSRRLSQIIKSNHNLSSPTKDDEGAADQSEQSEHSEQSDTSSGSAAAKKPLVRRYSSIRARPPDLGSQDRIDASDPALKVVPQRASIAQKFLSQVSGGQAADRAEKQPPAEAPKSNRVKQLASQYGGARQAEPPQIKRRSTFSTKGAEQLAADGAKQRRSSITGAQPEKEKEEAEQPKEQHVDNRANLAQKFLSQVSSNQAAAHQKDAAAEQAKAQTRARSQTTSEATNRVKQLASQINSVTSAQQSPAVQSQKTRRNTEASKPVTSVPDLDGVERRRSSQTDGKVNPVMQLAGQINTKMQAEAATTTTAAAATTTAAAATTTATTTTTAQAATSSQSVQSRGVSLADSAQSFAVRSENVSSTSSVVSTSSTTRTVTTTTTTKTSASKTSSTSSTTSTKAASEEGAARAAITSSAAATKAASVTSEARVTEATSAKAVRETSETRTDASSLESVALQARGAPLDLDSGGVCNFEWGSNDSIFSSSFTGYSECSQSLGSTVSDTTEKLHCARHEDHDAGYKVKPEWHQKVFGELLSATNLPATSGKVFATLQLRGIGGLKHFKFTTADADPGNPVFNTKVNFERVKKGDSIEIAFFTRGEGGEHVPIASAELACRTLKENADEVYRVKLERPPLRMYPESLLKLWYESTQSGEEKDLGEAQMSLNTNIEFTVLD